MERLVVIATVKAGNETEADRLLAGGPPFDPGAAGLAAHAVYRAGSAIVFVFEGSGADEAVRQLLNDPARSGDFGAWAPVLDGVPRMAHEVYYWRREA